MKQLRVLHINAGSRNFGGVSAMCLNLYRNISRDQVQFEFLTPNQTTFADYRDEIEKMGGTIYELGIDASSLPGKFRLVKALKTFFGQHHYDVVHINSGVLLFNCMVLYAARRYARARIFVHSHSNGGRNQAKDALSPVLKAYLGRHADRLLACSESAARYMFPEKCIRDTVILDNGIDTGLFAFDPEVRAQVRAEYGLDGKFVIGHVGRFAPSKNHHFLIELLGEVRKKKGNACLMLIGQGELMEDVRKQAAAAGLAEHVLFLGQRKDTGRLYQAMDVFALPSVNEGFGIVNLEAETSGLKCVVSDVVPDAANVTGLMKKLSLKDSLQTWADELLDVPESRRSWQREIIAAGYDIRVSAEKLEKMYLQ